MIKRKKWLKKKTLLLSFSCLVCFFFIASPALSPACGSPADSPSSNDDGKAKWTVMVYMDGDNSLEEFAVEKFKDFAESAEYKGVSNDVNILVQFDRIWGYDTSYNNWTTTRRFEVFRCSEPVKTDPGFVKDLGELDMGAPGTLIDFVNWAKNYRPAEKYMLIMSNHGFGWKRGLCEDDTNEDFLTAAELRSALHRLTRDGKQKIDVFVLDACLMAMVEIDYQVNRYCKFRVASENVEYTAINFDYAEIITKLVKEPDMSAKKLALTAAKNYTVNLIGTTISAVNLESGYRELVKAVDHLASYLKDHSTDFYHEIWNSIGGAQHLDDWEYIDLYDIASILYNSCSNAIVKGKTHAVMKKIKKVVIYNNFYPFAKKTNGITVYFPKGKNSYLDFYDGKAGFLNFTADTCWDEFIKEYQGKGHPKNLAASVNGGEINAVGGGADISTAKPLIDNGFSCWISDPGKAVFGNFITVQLAHDIPYFIDKIYLDPGPVDNNEKYMLNLFHIDLSTDGKEFETVYWGKIDPSLTNQFKVIDISAMKKQAKYVKVVVDSNQGNQLYSQVIISEMQVYGHSPQGKK